MDLLKKTKKKPESIKYIFIDKDTFWTWKLKCLMILLLVFNKFQGFLVRPATEEYPQLSLCKDYKDQKDL